MVRKKTNYLLPLAIMEILHEDSDKNNPLTIKEIQEKLKSDYSFEASSDLIKDLFKDLSEYYSDCNKTTNLEKLSLEMHFEDTPNKTKKIFLSKRFFTDNEIDILTAPIELAPSTSSNKETDYLIKKLEKLKSPTGRSSSITLRPTAPNSPKPSATEIAEKINQLKDAIQNKQNISLEYVKYGTKASKKEGGKLDIENETERIENISPYLIKYINEHFFLLASGKRRHLKQLQILRIDLIKKLEILTDKAYKDTSLENIEDYFLGSINGFSGKKEKIILNCNKKAIHYVIENFSDFENFRMEKGNNENQILVSFYGNPTGVSFWTQKFIDTIEIKEPVKTREELLTRLKNNAYNIKLPD